MSEDDRQSPDEEAALRLPSLKSAFRRGRRRAGQPVAKPADDDSVAVPAQRTTMTEEPAVPAHVEAAREEAATAPRVRRSTRVHVPAAVAAAVTGALVGLTLVGLTWVGLHACTSLRGTSSCGTPGVLVLLAITVVSVVLGSLLLWLAGVTAHASTSLLGVALLVVLVLLALLPVLDEWWVVVVVPAVSVATFTGASWLTTTYAEPER
jgi:hypothetical protein